MEENLHQAQVDPEEILQKAVRALVSDHKALKQIAISEMQWLTMEDLIQLTGYDKQTISKWRDNGWIRMFQVGDSREWRTTLVMWREDQDILIRAGLLDNNGIKLTAKERKRQIAELKRRKLGL